MKYLNLTILIKELKLSIKLNKTEEKIQALETALLAVKLGVDTEYARTCILKIL